MNWNPYWPGPWIPVRVLASVPRSTSFHCVPSHFIRTHSNLSAGFLLPMLSAKLNEAPPALVTFILWSGFMVTLNAWPSAVVSVIRIALSFLVTVPVPSLSQVLTLLAFELPEKLTWVSWPPV